jgi:hypothetical protein
MVVERGSTTLQASSPRKPSALSARGARRASGSGAPAALPEATLDAVPFQAFDEAPPLLPGGQRPREVMQMAISRMRFRSVHDEGRFTRGWLTEHSQRLLCAFAWHAVYSQFDKCASLEAADRLFSHIASAYARLFADGPGDVKDALAWYLPEALSHAAILALRTAYARPPDPERLGEPLRRALFEQFVEWTSGFGGTTGRQVTRSEGSSPRGGGSGAYDGDASGGPGGPRGGRAGPRPPRIPLAQLLGAEEDDGTAPAAEAAGGGRFGWGRMGGGRMGGGSPRTRVSRDPVEGGSGADGDDLPLSPRRSMVVGGLPPARRAPRDVSACSPLMARWLKLRQLESEARGGSSSREPHRVRCTHAAGRGLEQIDKLVEKGALTLRDVRTASLRHADYLVSDYSSNLRDTMNNNNTITMMGRIQIAALRSEEARVLAKGPDTMREYANYLCAMRKLHEESDEVRHAREEAGTH